MADYTQLLASQYYRKPRATATILLLLEQWTLSFIGASSIPDMLNIDTARGKNLDIIGKIVGQDRVLPAAVDREFFAFTVNDATKGFRLDGTGGSPWYRHGDAITASGVLSDSEMRVLIKVRVIRNFTRCNLDDLENACVLLFGEKGYQVDITAPCVWSITTYSASKLALIAAQELDILPRAAGIRYEFSEE